MLVGVGAALPIGVLAILALGRCPLCELSLVLAGLTAGLVVATIAVADGQPWGALVIALYGAGVAVRYWLAIAGFPYATTADTVLVAYHVGLGVLGLAIAVGLVRAHTQQERP